MRTIRSRLKRRDEEKVAALRQLPIEERLRHLERQMQQVIGHRQNRYRDFWLLAVTALLVWITILAYEGSQQAKQDASAIQQQRIETIGSSCTQQNKRHDDTIIELDRQIVRHLGGSTIPQRIDVIGAERVYRQTLRKLPPMVRAQTVPSHDGTVLLINRLAPRENCRIIVYRSTHQGSIPPLAGEPHYPPFQRQHQRTAP